MGLFRKKKQPELTRRQLVEQRRRASQEDGQLGAQAYVRNRTMSAHHAHHEEVSERQRVHDLRKRRRRLTSWLCASVAALAVIGVVLTQFSAELRVATPAPIEASATAQYTEIMRDYFAKQPLERLRFLINEQVLHVHFLEHAPEVQSVQLAGGGLGVSVMRLSFRQPTLQWSAAGKTFFVDAHGVTFEKNYFAAPTIAVDDQSGVSPEMGREVINRQFLSFLGVAVAQFAKQNVNIERVVLPEGTVRQVAFSIVGQPYDIKMTVDRSAEAQVEQAMHAMRYVNSRQLRPSYIDVRVNQRVFYK